jgi:hypothetical protein
VPLFALPITPPNSPHFLSNGASAIYQRVVGVQSGFSLTSFEETEIKAPWPESASKLYRLSDRRLLAKLVPTFDDRHSHLVSVTDCYGRILGFLERNLYFFFQVALKLYSRG